MWSYNLLVSAVRSSDKYHSVDSVRVGAVIALMCPAELGDVVVVVSVVPSVGGVL